MAELAPTPLPMAPTCSLDEPALREQLARYRAVGAGASVVERGSSRVSIELDAALDEHLVDELIAVERACCPFFTISWSGPSRRLTIGVSTLRDEPALAAVCFALGLDDPSARP